MNGEELLINGWDFEPWVVIGCAGLAAWYLTVRRGKTVWFLSGVLLLFLDLSSPLDLLADQYLFSAHMVQDLVLALVVPPLLILGMPPLRLPRVPAAAAWGLGVGTMVFWYVPVFFHAAPVVEHLSFLVSGVIFWLPVIERRTGTWYLLGACAAFGALGVALMLAKPYLAYVTPDDQLGLLPLIRGDWGIDPQADQKLGGLLMCGTWCLVARRFAIFTAGCALALIGVGACLTSTVLPIPGAKPGPAVTAPGLEMAHLILAGLTALLTIGLAVWVRSLFGWIALGMVLVESALGGYAPVLQGILAPILFTSLVAVAIPESPIPVTGLWPSLRTMSMLAPVLVLLQISLGAGFRHEVLGVVWHILNAGIVLLVIMVLGVCLLRQFPEYKRLRRAAIALLVITGIQVLLGFAVYLTLLIVSENNQALIVLSVAHVLTGSLTLAASTVLALELRRVTDPSLTVTAGGA